MSLFKTGQNISIPTKTITNIIICLVEVWYLNPFKISRRSGIFRTLYIVKVKPWSNWYSLILLGSRKYSLLSDSLRLCGGIMLTTWTVGFEEGNVGDTRGGCVLASFVGGTWNRTLCFISLRIWYYIRFSFKKICITWLTTDNITHLYHNTTAH